MGNWTYYICKMTMKELAGQVRFAAEMHDDRTLDQAIQRELNEGRVKKEIVSFLQRREDRFFSSIVIASLGGNPQFLSVRITDDDKFQLFVGQGLDEDFGILTMSGDQDYYALDGQHRLKAIQTLINRNDPDSVEPPIGFPDEEVSVILVVRKEKADKRFLQAYRRLFSSLNRHAKATNRDTNIIMDEDDTFAILTRRLITEHEFFKWDGRQKDSPRVKTKGKNLNTSDSHFTSLQTLYYMNEILLTTSLRENSGWGESEEQLEEIRRFRQAEEELDSLYAELEVYWNGLLKLLPVLNEPPQDMRIHTKNREDDSDPRDHLLFWPIGQEMLAKVVRRTLNRNLENVAKPSVGEVVEALGSISKLEWELHEPPWRYFLLTWDEARDRWRMRSEDRSETLKVARRILEWQLGLDDLTDEDIRELKLEWQTRLIPSQEDDAEDDMWARIEERRREITQE